MENFPKEMRYNIRCPLYVESIESIQYTRFAYKLNGFA